MYHGTKYKVHGTPLFLKKYKSTGTCTVVLLVHVRTRLIPGQEAQNPLSDGKGGGLRIHPGNAQIDLTSVPPNAPF